MRRPPDDERSKSPVRSAYTHAVRACQTCGEENPERARFCLNCATPLAEESSPGIEERKVVSVLFCDLVGFTATSDSTDPEDTRALLRPYHALLRKEIEHFGGTVEKFIGDAVMAVFGAPIVHEDDAERALRAALRILEAIAELNDDRRLDLQVRIGINTGEAVVAVGARAGEGEGIVTGDVVNTASRLQGVAPVDGIVVGENTFRSTRHLFEYRELEPATLKGKAKPVLLWQALSAHGRFGVDVAERIATPFVGRDLEMTLLQGAFGRSLRDPSLQLVTIAGEPGVGKTRLVSEFFRYIDEGQDELVFWRQGRCLPYGNGVTFWALGEIVKAHAGILETDDQTEALAKLEHAVTSLNMEDSDREWVASRLAPLVGISLGPGSNVEQSESFAAWQRFLEGVAALGPLVVVIEDLHWADAAMLDFIEQLVEWWSDLPIMLLCNARPELYERRPGWGGGQRNVTTISLAPLTDDETAKLVTELLSKTVLPADVRNALLERAGGNPLYAEEFVRMLTDRGVVAEVADGSPIAADIAVPDSIQSVIAARLDTLSAAQKTLLQDAAVVGKVFWSGALASMGGLDEELVRKELHELSRRELVRHARRSSVEATSEYAFWHVLTRDVAYGEIPRSVRAAKHLAAASWIERTAGERAADQAEVLAYHHRLILELTPAADVGKLDNVRRTARHHIVMAGDRALGLDVERALALYEEALAIDIADARDGHGLRIRLGETATRAGQFPRAVETLEQAVDAARAEGDELGTALALVALHEPMSFSARPGAAEVLDEAIGLLEARPPSKGLAQAYTVAAFRSYARDENRECLDWVEKALDVSKTLGIDPSPRLYSSRGGARVGLGDMDGLDDLRLGLDLARDTGDAYIEARIRNSLGTELYSLEGPGAALEEFENALALAEHRSMSGILIDVGQSAIDALYDLGRWDELLERARDTSARAEDGQDMFALVYIQTAVADVNSSRGEYEEAARLRGWWTRTAEELGQAQVVIPAYGVAAAVSLAIGEPREAIEVLRRIEARPSIKGAWNFAAYLPEMVRTALGAGDRQLAGWLAEIEAKTPYAENASLDVQARLAEADEEHVRAADLFADAAARWGRFGVVPEHAHALLGLGRSRRAGKIPEWAPPLEAARDIYTLLGAQPFIEETDALLAASTPPGHPA